ncbi:MAG: helix-hairpin-helix domain-containing protein [Patescibacteria group bacterium]|nr:helix-hairpin-helix domain-containing protein [Patescibacteria group bacterium]
MLIKPIWLTLGLAGGLLIVVGVLSVVIINSRIGPEEFVIEKVGGTDELENKLMVDVGGAVVKPGVYELKGDSRINEALIAAGGLGEEADRDWVEKNLNLAAKVKDGQKIYIPDVGESEKVAPLQSKGTTLNINTASIAELDTLAGVGEATANKIIDNRPYGAVEELLTKKAVSNKVYEAIKENVSIY